MRKKPEPIKSITDHGYQRFRRGGFMKKLPPDPIKDDFVELKKLMDSANDVFEQREHSSYCMMVTARKPVWIYSNKFCDCIRRINLGLLKGLSALYGEAPDECKLAISKEIRHVLKQLTTEPPAMSPEQTQQ